MLPFTCLSEQCRGRLNFSIIKTLLPVFLIVSTVISCNSDDTVKDSSGWSIHVLPPSVRLDPASNEVIDERFILLRNDQASKNDMLDNNLIFNSNGVSLHSARGEYVSFQVVITNHSAERLDNIRIKIPEFTGNNIKFKVKPELFLEWSVEVKTPSTGYPDASLGTGWYPDALIPFEYIQYDSSKVRHRWTYPLWLPDFNNRIDNQKSMILWVDQYVPFNSEDALPGKYTTKIAVTIGSETQEIQVELTVWDFAIPNENRFKAGLQHEGFVKSMGEKQELEIYQLLKRNRIAMLDPTYEPEMKLSQDGTAIIDWTRHDARLEKYFSGRAFTTEYGYNYGPGYGEPVETFVLPFDVYGKHGTRGWPDIGTADAERNDKNREIYIDCIKQVRNHFSKLIDPSKTDITVYLNGLDESYFPEAWSRMVYYGDIFREYYPEALFRIDGGYTEEALQIVKNSISSWASHTIEYDYNTVRKYQEMGIKVWLYGPMLYESKINSWVGSSTILDLPLMNDRAISWCCWKYRTFSWLSWGAGAGWVNGWYDTESWKDASIVRSEQEAEFTFKKINGSALMIYAPGVIPNVTGPCPSIRLKAMRDGVQEYEYMRLLAEADGNNTRVDSIVNSIIRQPFGPNSIGNLDVWSFDAEEWDKSRILIGELINEMKQKQ